MSTVIVESLIENLSKGVATFKYRKVDGSIREAKGTINPELTPATKDETARVATDGPTISYYDMDAKAWRSFRRDSVIG